MPVTAAMPTLRSLKDLEREGLVASDPRLSQVADGMAIGLTEEMLAQIDRRNPTSDPIARQFVPDVRELNVAPGELADPIALGLLQGTYRDGDIVRVDAVLLDNVLAFRRSRTVKGFTVQPGSVATGHYVGVLAKADAALRDQCNAILKAAMQDGSLERIFRTWQVWNDDQGTDATRAALDRW